MSDWLKSCLFLYFMLACFCFQECEASPQCRRLQLKDLLVSEMQRLTKYPLLLDNIIKHTEGEEQQCLRQDDGSNRYFSRTWFLVFSQPGHQTSPRFSTHRLVAGGYCRPSTRTFGRRNTVSGWFSTSADWMLLLSSRWPKSPVSLLSWRL